MVVDVLCLLLLVALVFAMATRKPIEIKITVEHKEPPVPKVDYDLIEDMKAEIDAEEKEFYEGTKSVIATLNDILTGEYKEPTKK